MAVCGYKLDIGFVSQTTLIFDRVYDEVSLRIIDFIQFLFRLV